MTDVEFYCTVNNLKVAINLSPDNTLHRARLISIVDSAQTVLNQKITPYADIVPVPAGDPMYPDIVDAAKNYAISLWYQAIRQDKLAKSYTDRFDANIEGIINSYKANRTTRTKSVAVSRDPRDRRLILPSQRYTALLDGGN